MAKPMPVEPHVLCPSLLALQFFAQAIQERQLLGGIEPFQPLLLNDLFQPLAQRLIEGGVLFHADINLVTDGVLHLARLRLVGLERINLLFKLPARKAEPP